ncbi:ribonuclease III [Actinomyces minihominis]|uniref:ribonuclease III n=1 Tax=Actinomyces minihominis TaxID=2002838 RepID=UPI000C0866C5|nr:ribonuclease III [Actinomyces minihominis]
MAKKAPSGAINKDAAELLEAWGVDVDLELLVQALTHRSFAFEVGLQTHNERLEFLGDSVLSVVATDELFHRYPDAPESDLARIRNAVVSQKPLAQMARSIGLGEFILLGVGENKTGGRNKASILSDTMEALIGATYLSQGLEPTRKALLKHLAPIIDRAQDPEAIADWKTPLSLKAKEHGWGDFEFTVTGHGPDHDRSYEAQIFFGTEMVATGVGPSKKVAENDAARAALTKLTEGLHA